MLNLARTWLNIDKWLKLPIMDLFLILGKFLMFEDHSRLKKGVFPAGTGCALRWVLWKLKSLCLYCK